MSGRPTSDERWAEAMTEPVLASARFPAADYELPFWTQSPSLTEIDAYLATMDTRGWYLVGLGGQYRNGRFTYQTCVHKARRASFPPPDDRPAPPSA